MTLNRRTFLSGGLASMAPAAEPKKIAAIVTEYRFNSHADVIVGKYLDGYRQDGKSEKPRSRIVSMYTDQVPKNDLSREQARKHGVPIYATIPEALTLGSGKLAVDGVLFIGEHGNYPTNEKGQKLYPRYELFTRITDVFRQTGRAVPVFSDKHLSYSWAKAKRMVEIARELHFPFMAGSSIPVAFRKPLVDTPYGAKVRHAVAIGYSDLDAYGFHMLEGLQCMVERRAGGETGVASVQCLENDAVRDFVAQTPWARRLFDQAIARSERKQTSDPFAAVKTPAVFLIRYRDGLEAAGFMMTGAVEDFTAALEIEGQPQPLSTLFWLEPRRPYQHFECLVRAIEKMFETGRPPYPVERTLLTSGVLDFQMESRFRGHQRINTPELDVRYLAPRESHFCTSPPV